MHNKTLLFSLQVFKFSKCTNTHPSFISRTHESSIQKKKYSLLPPRRYNLLKKTAVTLKTLILLALPLVATAATYPRHEAEQLESSGYYLDGELDDGQGNENIENVTQLEVIQYLDEETIDKATQLEIIQYTDNVDDTNNQIDNMATPLIENDYTVPAGDEIYDSEVLNVSPTAATDYHLHHGYSAEVSSTASYENGLYITESVSSTKHASSSSRPSSSANVSVSVSATETQPAGTETSPAAATSTAAVVNGAQGLKYPGLSLAAIAVCFAAVL
jgi:hypothetical protein